MTKFRCWWPEDGETVKDAIQIEAFDHEDAAEDAAKFDSSDRDGWERDGDRRQRICVQEEGSDRADTWEVAIADWEPLWRASCVKEERCPE